MAIRVPTFTRRMGFSGDFRCHPHHPPPPADWLGPTNGAEQTSQVGITIERRVPLALALLRRVEDLPLTAREKHLCLLLARGLSVPDLAAAMGLTASTVISHQRSIHAKLGVHSRVRAARHPANAVSGPDDLNEWTPQPPGWLRVND